MTEAWKNFNRDVFNSQNPYTGFALDPANGDVQGWNSHHQFLTDTIAAKRPGLVVEVGVWKGGSTISMAAAMKDNDIDGVVVSVDTFLGSWEHYELTEWFPSLKFKNGYPTLFYTFLTNVVMGHVEEYVHPLPLDSANAFFVLNRKGIKADVIHIDAGHDYEAVTNDLTMWWQILSPGGTLIVDDYDETGRVWPTVRDAVDDFLAKTAHEDREAIPYKLRVGRPL